MSLPSPVDQYGNKMSGSGYGSSGQSDSGKGNAGSPLSMSLGFLKNLTEKKSTRGKWRQLGRGTMVLTINQLMAKFQKGEGPSQTANLP
jgi:hypothetical protein